MGLFGTLQADAPLTESALIEALLAKPEWQAITQLPASQAAGTAKEAKAWLSPGLEWSQEKLRGFQPSKQESTLMLTQSVDVSGRWLAHRNAALKREEAGKAESALRKAALVAQAREAFFDLLAARERVARVNRALNRLSKVQDQVDRLHTAGDISGLDRGRVRREMALLKGRETQEKAALYKAETRLAALLNAPVGALTGEVMPPEPEPLEKLQAALEGGSAAELWKAQEAAAHFEAKAARRWIPELNLGLGVKRWKEEGLSGSGSVFSIGFNLPTLGRVQGNRMRLEAEARASVAESRIQRETKQAELKVLWREWTDLRASAQGMAQDALEDSDKTEAGLEAAFAAGEIELLERLDGSRSLLEAELSALEQAHLARRACIALEQLIGKVNP